MPLMVSLLNTSKDKQVRTLGAGLRTLARNNLPSPVSLGNVEHKPVILAGPELKVKTK